MSKKANGVFDEVLIGTVVGTGTVIDGNFTSEEGVRIDGTVNGNIKSEAVVVVDTQGVVNGSVSAKNILIAGTINGDATAQNKTELTSTGKIYGDITTRTLSIDEQAVFVGKCSMNPSAADENFDN